MDANDVERVGRVAKAAIGLGVSLAFAPLRLVLRAVLPSSASKDEQRWAAAGSAGTVEPIVPLEAVEAVEAESPGLRRGVRDVDVDGARAGAGDAPRREPAPAPAVPPSPHISDLTSADAARLRAAEREAETTPDSPGPQLRVEEPWPGYDAMNIAQVLEQLIGADPTMRAMVRLYEERHKNRKGVLRATE